MGYTGEYSCPVGDDFSVDVTQDRYERSGDPNAPKFLIKGTSEAGRAAVLAHGLSDHGVDWSGLSNTAFAAVPETLEIR
jgi:hypothetical protein